jgi:hypothetical protein
MATRISSCPFPANMNPLGNSTFKFTITKLPEVKYFLQEVELPTIILGETTQSTSFVDVPIPGDRVTFDVLNISFLIDSEMANYKAIFNWIQGQGFPEGHFQYAGTSNAYSDATLEIIDNLGSSVAAIQFVDLVPTSLAGITLQSNVDDVTYLVGRATFRYSYYRFI